MRWTLLIAAAAAACGNNGAPTWPQYAAKCATPRSGNDPFTGQAYPDRQGTADDEKTFLRLWTNDLYLWYREVPGNLDPKSYATPLDYFAVLKTPLTTPSGNPKDRFHFTYETAVWDALSESGVEAGYGAFWEEPSRPPQRKIVAAYDETGSPAAQNNIVRGAQVMTVDGVAVLNGDATTVLGGLFPATVGETHTFDILDPGATATRKVSMTSIAVTSTPVRIASTPAAGVGYLLFNSFVPATAEKELVDAFNQLKGVSDLVLDLRYNGGGLLITASELAYMIAGPAATAGKTFELSKWNDKHPTVDPIQGAPITPLGFLSQTEGLSVTAGQPLPHLDLSRVFVLSSSETCSASESVINGLRGVDVQVILIGGNTCGKPYSFYPQDNCGTTYFSIEMQGVNQKGFGDYADGFVPAGTLSNGVPGCLVADDFSHQLGDVSEARFAAALQYRGNQTCPPPSSSMPRAQAEGGMLARPPWFTNRLFRVRR